MKMKETLHIYYRTSVGGKVEEPVIFLSENMAEYGYIYGSAVEVEFEIPAPPSPSQVISSQVAILRAKQGKLQHESDKIEEAIQKLMCIEHKPE